VKALTHKAPAPEPKPRRRRSGETRSGFKLAAVNIMRRRVTLPAVAYAAAAFLSHTLDWLNPWHHDATSSSELNDDFHYEEPTNHLSPHL
jgi:imidazole glycerol phosphate synthase subunit HisF